MLKGKYLKKLFLILVILLITLCFSNICNNVQAMSLTAPEEYGYLRWNPADQGLIDVKAFSELFAVKGEIYNVDNTAVKEDQLVGTGMYYFVDDTKIVIIVKGDVNGDGNVSPTDLSILKSIYVGLKDLDYCHKKAGDINNDNELTLVDISQLKMMLVGLPLPEEEEDPNDTNPKLDGEIEIVKSVEGAAKEVIISVNWPSGKRLEGCTKKISLDGGETYQEYTGEITLDKNTVVVATYFDKDENVIASDVLRLENVDTEAPNEFEFTTETTTSSIMITAETEDRLRDYEGNLIENEFTGISKYLYKLDDGEWQESNAFTGLKANTEYTVYVKAIDYAGNEREATNNGIKVKTDPILDPTQEGSRILVSKDIDGITCLNVTVTFSLEDPELANNFDIQYQVNSTTGEWITGTKYVATGNCKIYARLIDKYGQASEKYVTTTVSNIDKLAPNIFTPVVEYVDERDVTVVKANTEDAPADEANISSGLKYYVYNEIHESGKITTGNPAYVETNEIEYKGNLFEKLTSGEEDPIIGFVVDVIDAAGNMRRSEYLYLGDVSIPDDELGIGNFNEGPGNVTVQGADKSYYNPVVPVGFKAVDTEEASWGPYMPSGWNDGLVIEDKSGNQFVWVPVPCEGIQTGKDAIDSAILNPNDNINGENEYLDEIPEGIANEEITVEAGRYGYEYRTEIIEQVEEYQGFYIARYEAGKKDGLLATQEGLETVNMVTYDQAKTLAEEMYQNPYVVSGLPTGVHWNLLSEWIEKEYGREDEDYSNKGNLSYFTFTFTGRYAEGPDFGSTEVRGEYKDGENVNKKQNEEMLLTTGIVEEFRMKNMYDLLGNVWEYTSEKVTLKTGVVAHNARGADYYWESSPGKGLTWKVSNSEYVVDGDVRNEGGFRPVLFLSEGKANVEGEYNGTINGGKADYNNPVIPAGYKPVNTDEAQWGDGTLPAVDWDKGLVIEDKNGNQFVWVPVDGTEVKYETWLDVYLTHDEVGESELPESWIELGGTEDSTVEEFKGFYIARYETSQDLNGKVQTKENQAVKTIVSYNEAVELTNNYENGKTSVAGIITGKQWDSVLRWIANEKGEDAVTTNSTSWGNYNSSLAPTGRSSAKNIYDMAGNAWELTSETYEDKIVYRGGSAYESGTTAPAGYRDAYNKDYSDGATTYRMVLYVKNDGYNVKPVAVPGDNPGIATGAKDIISYTITPSGWTNKDVTVKLSTTLPFNLAYSVAPVSTKQQGDWEIGNEITLSENATILVKLMDETGNTKGATEVIQVNNIDKIAPEAFIPTVTVENSRVRIKCSTVDNESGIKQYHFYADNGTVIHAPTKETNVLSSTLSVGIHKIYVVAEDNAGNTIKSGAIEIEITVVKLTDVLAPGVWVRAPLGPYRVMGPSNGSFTILATVLTTYYLGAGNEINPSSDWAICQFCPVAYATYYTAFQLDHQGGPERCYMRHLYDPYSTIDILSGNGTKEDPYYVDSYWYSRLNNNDKWNPSW